MKVHKITMFVVDHQGLGAEGCVEELECTRNDYVHPYALAVETVDIGEWRDDHPINITETMRDAATELFREYSDE